MKFSDFNERFPAQTMQCRVDNVGRVTFRYIDTGGGGAPLLMLPGAGGVAHIFWQQIAAQAGRRRIISVTYPSLPDTEAIADSVRAFLQSFQIRKCSLFGASLGASISRALSSKYPDIIDRMILCNGSHYPGGLQAVLFLLAPLSGEDARGILRASIEQYDESTEQAKAAKIFALASSFDLFTPDQIKNRLVASALAAPPGPRIPGERIMLIECEDDPGVKPFVRQRMRALYPRSTIYCLPEGGHIPYLVTPGAISEIIENFLTDQITGSLRPIREKTQTATLP